VPVMMRISAMLMLLLLGIFEVGLGKVNSDHAPGGAGLFSVVIETGDRNESRALRHGPDFVADSFPEGGGRVARPRRSTYVGHRGRRSAMLVVLSPSWRWGYSPSPPRGIVFPFSGICLKGRRWRDGGARGSPARFCLMGRVRTMDVMGMDSAGRSPCIGVVVVFVSPSMLFVAWMGTSPAWWRSQ
jgi:hypothetical protein